MKIFLLALHYEIKLLLRSFAELLFPVWFFVLTVMLFPLALSDQPQLLQQFAPGIIWIGALLAMLLSFDRLFSTDFTDGSLEQILMSNQPLSLLILAKCFAHWLVVIIPLLFITPLLGLLLHVTWHNLFLLLASLMIGTPIIVLIGAIAAALTVGMCNRGILLIVLILPLIIPIIIFAVGSVVLGSQGIMIRGQLALLGALLIFTLIFAPWIIAKALRISL